MTSEKIISYLKDERRRPLLKFSKIEKNYGLQAKRIYSVLYANDVKGEFRPAEVVALSKAIADLQSSIE